MHHLFHVKHINIIVFIELQLLVMLNILVNVGRVAVTFGNCEEALTPALLCSKFNQSSCNRQLYFGHDFLVILIRVIL